MSLKLRFRYQYQNLLRSLAAIEAPGWLFSVPTRLLLIVLIVGLMVGYVLEINALSTSGYVIHTLEKRVAAISQETRKLSTEVAEFQSMASIQKRLKDTALIAADKIQYLAGKDAVAKR